jgi:hypothetical protein
MAWSSIEVDVGGAVCLEYYSRGTKVKASYDTVRIGKKSSSFKVRLLVYSINHCCILVVQVRVYVL